MGDRIANGDGIEVAAAGRPTRAKRLIARPQPTCLYPSSSVRFHERAACEAARIGSSRSAFCQRSRPADNTSDYGGFVARADEALRQRLVLPAGYSYQWSGEYEFELRAKKRLELILPIVFFVIFLLLYMIFRSAAEAAILILPAVSALTGGLILQWLLHCNFSVAVWVGYIARFGIAIETGVVMVVYLHEALDERLARGEPVEHHDLYQATIQGAVL
ncbi:MAG TPA: efflux RND transporter permease subunit [Terriglobia bacterium]|nr:efflux RND transporter permease subunit [Terriglobia bacterium]